MHPTLRIAMLIAGSALTVVGCATTDQAHSTTTDPVANSNDGLRERQVTRSNTNGNEKYTGTKDAMYTQKGDSIRLDPETVKACGNLPDAHFAFDSATLNGSTSDRLDGLAKCMTEGSLRSRSFSLVGHTDPRGGPDYNKELGRERAQSVARYLTAKGVKADRMAVSSVGEEQAMGADEAAWAADRVVDVKLAPQR